MSEHAELALARSGMRRAAMVDMSNKMTAREARSLVGYSVMYLGQDLQIKEVRKYVEWMLVLSNGSIIKPSEIR